MNISLLLFIIGSIFIIIGYANQISNKNNIVTEYVPKDIYENKNI